MMVLRMMATSALVASRKILKNLTKQSYTTMRSSNSLNNINTLQRWPKHSHTHRHLTIQR